MGEGRGEGHRLRDRRGQVLFIDARKLGRMVDRTHRELTDDEVSQIAKTYHAWRGSSSTSSPSPSIAEDKGEGESFEYADIAGFCKSATLEDIRKYGYVLTPGRYVGAEAQEDDGERFEEKMTRLTAKLEEQFAESANLDQAIRENLNGLGYGE